MYKSLITKAAAASFALILGTAAHAATVVVDVTETGAAAQANVNSGDEAIVRDVLEPGEGSATFTITANESLIFTELLLEASGFNFGTDIAALDITFTDAMGSMSVVEFSADGASAGGLSQGSAVFTPPPITVGAGESLTFVVAEMTGMSIESPVTLDLLATTAMSNMAPIPLPASGVLLLGVMAAGGFAAHRRNRKAAAA